MDTSAIRVVVVRSWGLFELESGTWPSLDWTLVIVDVDPGEDP